MLSVQRIDIYRIRIDFPSPTIYPDVAVRGGAGRSLELVDERGNYIAPPSLEYMLLRGGSDDPSIEVFSAELMAEASASKAAVAHAHAAIDEAVQQRRWELCRQTNDWQHGRRRCRWGGPRPALVPQS